MRGLRYALAVTVLAPTLAWAHGGAVDKNGCHHDKKAGDYHCHKGGLSGQHFKDEAEAVAALKSHGAQGEKMKSEPAKEKEATPDAKGGKKKETTKK